MPLELAMPVGQWRDVELSMMCAVSTQDCGKHDNFSQHYRLHAWCGDRRKRLPWPGRARRPEPRGRSASVSNVRFLVRSASGMVNQVGEKNDPASQPRVQLPQ